MVEEFRFDDSGAFGPLVRALGLGPRFSRIELDGDRLRVRMGWGFSARIPRSSIRSASHDRDRVTGWGVHGFRGVWLVNGSSNGLVRIEIDPPARAFTLGIPVRLRVLRISTTAADRLVAELNR